MSVKLWRGSHPQVVTGDGGGLTPMVPAFTGMGGAILLTFVALFVLRVRGAC